MTTATLDELNAAAPGEFARRLDGVFEHAHWVAERAAPARPFRDVAALHAALMAAVRAIPPTEQRAFLNNHPDLSAAALPPDLTEASRAEQGGAGLAAVISPEALAGLNAAYRARFGIPFMICLRRHTAADVLRRFRARLDSTPEQEHKAALAEVGHVSRLRLAARVEAPDAVPPLGRLLIDAPAGTVPALEQEGADAPLPLGRRFLIGRYALRLEGDRLPFTIEDPGRDRRLRLLRRDGGWALHDV